MAEPSAPQEERSVSISFSELVSSSYHDDLEDPTYHLWADEENVFDFVMFISPTESIKSHGKVTCDVFMGYLLVFSTLLIQGLLLTAVYDRVVLHAIQWQDGIFTTRGDRDWNLLGADNTKCNMGTSLCTLGKQNTFECAPPTIRLMGKWDELDTDDDGVWTREEATQSQEALKCEYGVDPIEVFDTVIYFVMQRKKLVWVHPDIKHGNAIPLPYFNYALGDIIMCGYRNQAMCRNVLQRGYFDAPLKYGTVPRIGNTSMSALNYCIELLREGGTCDRELPSAYSVWKIESDEECGEKVFNKFVYKHPKTGEKRSFLAVDYGARIQAEKVQMFRFKLYKAIIVMIWVMSMVYELKRLFELFTWLVRMPGVTYCRQHDLPLCQRGQSEHGFRINGITKAQRIFFYITTFLRLVMLVVLTNVGISLLLQSPSYMSLLFDAISLVFILELAQIIAKMVLRQPIREQSADVEPIEVLMFGPLWLTRRQGLLDLAWFLIVIIIAVCIMIYHYTHSVGPLEEALKCTCLGIGENCVEAQKFNYDFWYRYWTEITPQVFKDIDNMKQEELSDAFVDITPAAAANRTFAKWASGRLHARHARRFAQAVFRHAIL